MKKYTIAKLMGSLALFAMGACAQTSILHVQVPFEFHAGGKTMPSGTYRFEVDNAKLVRMLGPNGTNAVMIPPVHDFDQLNHGVTGVAFRKYGEDYFLARVVTLGGTGYYEWPPTSVEKVLAKRANVKMAWVRSLKITP